MSLSAYTIARDVNSNGAWGAALQLTGSIANGDVHVITRGNSAPAFTALADQLSSADAMSFNGDDPVGLFKNGTLIDIFGNFAGTNDFTNETYRRKSTVVGPTTAFDLVGEWDVFPQDNIDDLGSHSQTLGTTDFTLKNLELFPNPAKGNFINLTTSATVDYKIYNLMGRVIKTGKVTAGNISIQNLSQGVYLIQLKVGNQSVTKKLIRQ